jgi:hypothetical protein
MEEGQAHFSADGNNSSHPTPGIEWAQVSLSDLSTTTGYYSFSGDEAATYPAVMPDASGSVTMLFEHMGHKVFPETRYVVKGAGDSNFSGTGNLLKAGESSYRPSQARPEFTEYRRVPPISTVCHRRCCTKQRASSRERRTNWLPIDAYGAVGDVVKAVSRRHASDGVPGTESPSGSQRSGETFRRVWSSPCGSSYRVRPRRSR